MVTPLNQTVQNTAKCPHGFPVGACPICSGMSGGGVRRDKNKPRVAGEMSYNECMAEWMKMLAAKDAKIQAQKDRIENAHQRLLDNRIIQGLDKIQKNFDKLMQKIESFPPIVKIPAKIMLSIAKPIINLLAKIPDAIKNNQAFFQNVGRSVMNFINSTTEKLAMIFGEIKNFSDAAIVNKFKKALKSVLSLFTEGETDEEENEEIEKLKARELKKILKGIFKTKRRLKKEKNEESII